MIELIQAYKDLFTLKQQQRAAGELPLEREAEIAEDQLRLWDQLDAESQRELEIWLDEALVPGHGNVQS